MLSVIVPNNDKRITDIYMIKSETNFLKNIVNMRVSNFLQSSQLALSLAELGTAQPQLVLINFLYESESLKFKF